MLNSTPSKKTCNKCGQGDPVVTFRTRELNGAPYELKTCVSCERDDQRIRSSKPQTAMDVIREKAPRMEFVRREADKENDKLKKLLAEQSAELQTLKKIFPTAPNQIVPATDVSGRAIACMVASDWHVEEPVEKDKVHGINEYNLEIARSRAHNFFRNGLRLTNIYSASSDIDTIYLMVLGDTFSNWIHEELAETNLLSPTDAANFALGLLIDGINFLLENSNYKLIIDCIPGNHGRMTKRMRIHNATETSLETFMYAQLARVFTSESRVEFRVANSKMLYRKFFDYNIRLIHGDDIMYGGGIGGITIPIRKKLAAWDKAIKADLTVMGHFHQFMDGGDFLVNGSLIGYNTFAQSIGASPEEARQAFFIIHERNGGCKTSVSPIWLD